MHTSEHVIEKETDSSIRIIKTIETKEVVRLSDLVALRARHASLLEDYIKTAKAEIEELDEQIEQARRLGISEEII